MKRCFLAAALCAAALSLPAQTSVTHYVPGSSVPTGVVYYLPRTVIDVRAEAECIEEKPGPFYQYAERYLATDDVIVKERHEWRLKNVRITSHPEPDAERCFNVAVTKKDVAHMLRLSPSGIIEGVNLPEPPRPAPECAPERGPKADRSREPRRAHDAMPRHRQQHKDARPAMPLEFDMSVLGEEALVANSIPKMAEMAAKQIYRIRESRAALLSGEMELAADGGAVRAILEEMDRTECELVSLFTGKRSVRSMVRRYTYAPEEDVTNHVIFRISTIEGLLPADNLIGSPVYINVKGDYRTAPVMGKKEEKAAKGLYYIVPGSADVRVTDNGAFSVSRTLPVPQFGYATYLPAALTDDPGVSVRFSKEGTVVSVTH